MRAGTVIVAAAGIAACSWPTATPTLSKRVGLSYQVASAEFAAAAPTPTRDLCAEAWRSALEVCVSHFERQPMPTCAPAIAPTPTAGPCLEAYDVVFESPDAEANTTAADLEDERLLDVDMACSAWCEDACEAESCTPGDGCAMACLP